ncbi:RNA-binding protein 4B-like isoform X2 [Dendropsophus ebraccatus]|uniref:RNA-binding protein 4B-like isoform X2 n=1 Tax=Dendropsophus ebraccatus TaxID=150705 RepID=UPI0038315E4A
MVKLFIGNIPSETTPGELKALFEQYGKVTECDIITNYGFVHMEDKKAADEAVENLNQYKLHNVCINVEHSRGKPKASTKLHVSSISPDCTSEELREQFEQYGTVLECDIVKDFAFVHMEKAEEALEAIRNLNNYEFKGKIFLASVAVSSCVRDKKFSAELQTCAASHIFFFFLFKRIDKCTKIHRSKCSVTSL